MTGFSTVLFVGYLIWRRHWFVDDESITTVRPSPSEGAS